MLCNMGAVVRAVTLCACLQTAGTLMAKEPSLLALAAHNSDALRGLTGGLDEIVAVYEYYTMDWLQRQAKELQPARTRSFSSLHS